MLQIDTSLIVVFLVVWILIAVLSKVFFKPLRIVREERESKMEENQKAVDSALEAFDRESLRIEEQLRGAKVMAESTRTDLENEGLKERVRILEEANRECRNLISEAKQELNRQLGALKKELDARSQHLAERVERRLLG